MDRRLVGERTEFGEPGCFPKKICDLSTSRMTTSSEPTKTTTSRYVHFLHRGRLKGLKGAWGGVWPRGLWLRASNAVTACDACSTICVQLRKSKMLVWNLDVYFHSICHVLQHQDRLSRPCIEIVEISFFDLSKYSWIRCGHSEGNFWNTHQGFFSTSSCLLSHVSLGSDGGLSYGCTWTCGQFYGSLRRGEVDGRQRNSEILVASFTHFQPVNSLANQLVDFFPFRRNPSRGTQVDSIWATKAPPFHWISPLFAVELASNQHPKTHRTMIFAPPDGPRPCREVLVAWSLKAPSDAFVNRSCCVFVCWEWTWGVSEWCFFLGSWQVQEKLGGRIRSHAFFL